MTNEQKQLLLKDLSARLPYGLIVQYKQKTFAPYGEYTVDVKIEIDEMLHHRLKLLDFKPYLRPLSSMTEDEEFELNKNMTELCYDPKSGYVKKADPYSDSIYASVDEMNYFMNFMYSHHFDINNLIGKGLALTAPYGMYDTKNE